MVHPSLDSHETSAFLPIPTYEEAISRPPSTQSVVSDQNIQDGEREGLLSRRDAPVGYRAPTVESNRSSLASDAESSVEELRREVEQMGVLEPDEDHRHILATGRLSKHITNLTHTLSALHLPQLPTWIPSVTQIRDHVPGFKPNWILLGRLFALLLVLTLAYLLFLSNLFRTGRTGLGRNWIEPDALRSFFIDHVDESQIQEHLQYLSSFPHLAGTDGAQAQARYVQAIFTKALENVELEKFGIYINYARREEGSRRVALIKPSDLAFEAKLEETALYPNDAQRSNTPVYHGYSRSGTAQGPLIYANHGMPEDLQLLKEKGIEILGSVLLVRNDGQDPGSQIRAAELAGSSGCLIFGDTGISDNANDRYESEDAVQRDVVVSRAFVLGDPLSPGFASLDSEPRREQIDSSSGLSKIPSMPIAKRDFRKLLKALQGHGVQAEKDWIPESLLADAVVWSGDAASPVVELKNDLEHSQKTPIYNILGRIQGVEQGEKSIIIGNHRDAWCFGADESNGATAVMLEIVRLFGELQSIGWKPLRTIEFASWDGGSFNLAGSTEHVEARMDDIRHNAFAYVNIGAGATGRRLHATSSPLLEHVLLHTIERLTDPLSNKTLRSIFAEENGKVDPISAQNDHAAFQMLAGCSSLDFGFPNSGYPRHSCYDNYELMEDTGDPGFQYHALQARILALLILELADREILPFDLEAYADAINSELTSLEKYTNAKQYLDYSRLHTVARNLSSNAKEFHQWSQAWSNTILGAAGGFETKAMAAKRVSHNSRMANFESNLLDLGGGLRSREQYKHIFMAPSRRDSFRTTFYPMIRDAVDDGNWTLAQEQIDKTAQILSFASNKLLH